MSGRTIDYERLPLVLGTAAGAVAWLVGYALTYLVAAPEIEESMLQRFIEAVEGDPATYEMVGWVFYNSHMVDTVFAGIPAFSDESVNFIGGDDGMSVLLYLVPVGLLLAVGLAAGRSQGVDDISAGLLAGLTVVPGYLLLSILGLFVFEVTIGGATIGPARFRGLFLAGIAYPATFAGVGGVVAALTPTD